MPAPSICRSLAEARLEGYRHEGHMRVEEPGAAVGREAGEVVAGLSLIRPRPVWHYRKGLYTKVPI